MSLLEQILNANDGALVRQVAQQLGIDESQASAAVRSMLPAIQRGIARNTADLDGQAAFVRALQGGSHARYLEDPALVREGAAAEEGKAILGHVLGSKDVSRNVAAHASQQTGLDATVLERLLPVVASLAMGALSQRAQHGGVGGASGAQAGAGSVSYGGSPVMQALAGFLDADKDGSVADDLLNLAKRFF